MSYRTDISVIIPTSVIPSHPCTHILDWCIASVRSYLFNAPIFIMADGVRQEQEDRKPDYEEFKRRLTFPPWAGKVTLVGFETFHHQAAMLRATLPSIDTPLIFWMEHDWILTGDIPFDHMAEIILNRGADIIRLHQEAHTHEEHAHLFLEHTEISGVPLRKQKVYWAQPHLAYCGWYRQIMASRFNPYCRTMIEDAIYGLNLDVPWGTNGKVYMYDPPGNIKRVSHTDGRGKDALGRPLVDKFEDKFIF